MTNMDFYMSLRTMQQSMESLECSSVIKQLQESLYNNVMVSGAQSSLTPYILEERENESYPDGYFLD
jgi:hypothetical protein